MHRLVLPRFVSRHSGILTASNQLQPLTWTYWRSSFPQRRRRTLILLPTRNVATMDQVASAPNSMADEGMLVWDVGTTILPLANGVLYLHIHLVLVFNESILVAQAWTPSWTALTFSPVGYGTYPWPRRFSLHGRRCRQLPCATIAQA